MKCRRFISEKNAFISRNSTLGTGGVCGLKSSKMKSQKVKILIAQAVEKTYYVVKI